MNQEKIIMNVKELSAIASSKNEIYRVLTSTGELYLPPLNKADMNFIK
jgi:hypothetical protein